MNKLIVFISGQGTGKGTFCKMLLEQRSYNYVETGALFRALPTDSEIQKMIARGEMVPDFELFKLVESKLDINKDTLLDGFPRTLDQAKWLVEKYSCKFETQIMYLTVPREIMIQRIQKRAAHVGGRADDANIDIIEKRLNNFFTITMPAVEWLKNQNKIKFNEIDVSSQNLQKNFMRVQKVLTK